VTFLPNLAFLYKTFYFILGTVIDYFYDYGDRYQAVILITAPSGVSWQIRTGWIVLLDSDIARFVN
jgi:hypothetical protein